MAMEYVGSGAYIHGVPARDLSDEEQKKFADLIKEQEKLTGMKLYQPVRKQKQEGSED